MLQLEETHSNVVQNRGFCINSVAYLGDISNFESEFEFNISVLLEKYSFLLDCVIEIIHNTTVQKHEVDVSLVLVRIC